MKRFLFYSVIFCVLFSFNTAWGAMDSGTRFSDLAGKVDVAPGPNPDEEDYEAADPKMVLNVNDHIKTGIDSSAILSFTDMTTFVMKPESIIVLESPPQSDSKIKLVAGNVWVNVKKMMKDGSMEITMNQAVAGIKGTNITCSSDFNEDRVSVLRGQANITIRETRELITLLEGEEMVIKRGGRTERKPVDTEKLQKEWNEFTSQMGSTIDVNEIPDSLRGIIDTHTSEFSALQNRLKELLAGSGDLEAVFEFRKDVERYIGTVFEAVMVVGSMIKTVENAQQGDLSQEQVAQLADMRKLLSGGLGKLSGYQTEAGKMLRMNFPNISDSGNVTQIQEQVVTVWDGVKGLLQEVQSSPVGMSQSWFSDARDTCNEASIKINALIEDLQNHISRNPGDRNAQNLLRQLISYQTEITKLLKDLNVVEIDPGIIVEMQDIDDSIGAMIVGLQSEIAAYDAIARSADAEKRLRSSLSILSDFSRTRRLFLNAQRLYTATMRATTGQKFRTAEQDELQIQYDRISNTYNQLGIVADELESRVRDLESQLNDVLQ